MAGSVVSESFNPYHRWLGIREAEPTYYRLLGVDPFEDDPDVIEDGATWDLTDFNKVHAQV